MRRTGLFFGLVLASWLWTPATAVAQNRVEQQMILDLRTLQEQNQRLLQQLGLLGEQIKAVSVKVDAESIARSKGFADQQTQINSTNANLSALQERVSESKVQVQKMTQELDAVRKGVDMLTVMVTQALAQMPAATPPADPNAPAGSAPSQAGPVSSGVPPSSRDYFDRAYGDYTFARYELAIPGFEEYIKRFPTAPSAAQAQFLIGQSYFMMGRYQDAVAAYDTVITTYKGSDSIEQVTDAYYKQGVAYEQLKQPEKAIANFQLLRKDYPNSTAALLATQDLKQLGIIKN
jgi:tol-pal system protein YbgF